MRVGITGGRVLRCCTFAALAVASTLPVCAQTIRTETQVVLVDVVASDKKGYVRDLTIGDFRVFEDGKEQKLTSVSRETGTDGSTQTGPGSSASRKHYVVMLFDNNSMTGPEQQTSRQAAFRFLDSAIAAAGNPQSPANETAPLTAVVSFNSSLRVAQTFTEDSQRVKQAITGMPLIGNSISSPEEAQTIGQQTADAAARDTIHALDTLVRNLQSVPGRKSLVFFTAGIAIPSGLVTAMDAVINAANRSNIAFYPVEMRSQGFTSGTATADQQVAPTGGRGGRGRVTTLSSANTSRRDASVIDTTSGLILLADKTGGFVVRQPNDPAALAKASAEQSEYYLLGYTPPPSAPGSCHKLRVQVMRKGVDLRSRAEYCNRDTADLITSSPVQRTLEAKVQEPGTAPVAAPANSTITATQQTSFFYTEAGIARVIVAMEMDPSNIVFKKDKNIFQASIEILGLAQKADGSTSARFSDTKKLEFATQAEVDAFKKQPYRHEAQFDIAPGDYTLAIAFGAGVPASGNGTGGSFGRVTTPLQVDAYQTNDFMISGLAVGTQFRAANQTDAGLDELLIDDRKKLVADGKELVVEGSRRFKATAQPSVFFELYEPLWVSATTRASTIVSLQMLISDRATRTNKVDSGVVRLDLAGTVPPIKNGTAVVPLGLSLPLNTLSPGSYRVEIQVADTSGKNAKRAIDFEIE